MISIFVNGFDEEELFVMLKGFYAAQESYKCSTTCKDCENRKPCRDFSQAITFLEEKIRSM